MLAALDISKPKRELTRTGLELRGLSQAWSHAPRGKELTEALLGFLASKPNPNTRRAYAFAVLEFFTWYREKIGRIPTPAEVKRVEAHAFAEYLQKRQVGLDEQRLAQDPERRGDLEIYKFVRSNPGADIVAIRQHLLAVRALTSDVEFAAEGRLQRLRVLDIEKDEPCGDALKAFVDEHGRAPASQLDLRLACLVSRNLLRRTPTIHQVRTGEVDVGEEDFGQAQIGYRVDPSVFHYFIDEHTTASALDRVATVLSRLSALSSFWTYLADLVENQGQSEQLLKYNIWRGPCKELRRQLGAHQTVAREIKTPSFELFLHMFATCFARTHAEGAENAASAVLFGVDVSRSATSNPGIYDLRDIALFTLMFWTGLRASEVSKLKRSDVQRDEGATTLKVEGKGSQQRLIHLPPPALKVLAELSDAIERSAARSKSARAMALQLMGEDAPLLPPLKYWGRNSGPRETEGLTEAAIISVMRRRGRMAGIGPDDVQWRKLHPHGMRHLAATEARKRGVDLPTIQATLGHRSIASTGIYTEVRKAAERSLYGAAPPPAAPPTVVVPPTDVVEMRPVRPQVRKPPAEPEPAPPEASAEELGEPPEEPVAGVTEEAREIAEENEAVARVLRIYASDWGEPGKTTNLSRGSHSVFGKTSGLPWWRGPTGVLKERFSYIPNPPESFPAMPVISPYQVLLGSALEPCPQGLCQALSALYQRWLDEPGRGPTAAVALSRWVFAASLVTAEFDEAVERAGGGWVTLDAPLAETRHTGRQIVLREHLEGAILAWFERTAWQHRALVESRTASDYPLEVPSWYADADPLLAVPVPERMELLDWLRALAGLLPEDTTPRFGHGASRAQLGKVLEQMCAYHFLAADEDLDWTVKKRMLSEAAGQVALAIEKATAGAVRGFDYGAHAVERKREKVRATVAAAKAKREGGETGDIAASYSKYVAKHLLEVLGEVFGEQAAKDPVLALFSLCTAGSPLQGEAAERYRELFRVKDGNIHHKLEFALRFAKETGQHSECVARRLARHVYEEGRIPAWQKRRNWPEVLAYLDSMMAYRIPCPAAQERELRDRIGSDEPLPLYAEWAAARRRISAEPPTAEGELAEIVSQEQERRGMKKSRYKEPRYEPTTGSEHTRFSEARRYLPNSVDLVPLFVASRRR